MDHGSERGEVVVIGAGIVGLATAGELAARGRRVVVLDRGPIEGGCAVGSAGHLVPSHVVPLAAPGALRAAVSDLVRRQGALSVRWSAAPGFWRWIAGFARSCHQASVQTAAPALGELAALSDSIWDEWLSASGQAATTEGLLDVYAGHRELDRARRHAAELRRWGVAVNVLDRPAALALEPALLEPVAGAVHLVDDRSIDPARALTDLVARVSAAGAELRPATEVVGVETAGDRVVAVRTSGGDVRAEHVVIAAGAWSGRVAALAGERVPMLPARGFSVTVERPTDGPRRPLLLGEDHVAVAPLTDALRLSAWFHLNAFDTTVEPLWIGRLQALARRRIRLDADLTVRRRWAGLRPVTPDGVPIIGPVARWRNVTIAAGHSMVGLTLGPGTGRLVAQLVCGETPDIDLTRFSPRRFS
jgi:D-amino-acid dehydrogenase